MFAIVESWRAVDEWVILTVIVITNVDRRREYGQQQSASAAQE
jgi:hypothetical protein